MTAMCMKRGVLTPYMPSFGANDLLLLLDFLDTEGTCSFVDRKTFPKKVVVRHDVDHDLQHALKFAQWEAAYGIKSTYFILHSAWYWDDERAACFPTVRAIRDLGHEIGIHNDAISAAGGVRLLACSMLRMAIEALQDRGGIDIRGAADHGGELDNSDIWTGIGPSYFGLDYEAYQVQRGENMNYISDNRGKWSQEFHLDPDYQTCVLVHPEHWVLP